MGMLGARVLAAAGDAPTSPLDDRWYMPMLGMASDAGIAVSAQTILLCDAVLAAVRFRANAAALCPAKVFRAQGPDREQLPDHPTQRTLRDPTLWLTSFEWTQLNVVRITTWGNAYNRLVPGPDSFADELWPLHPSRTRVVDQRNDGGLVYVYKTDTGVEERIQQEQMLHYKDISLDGFMGIETYQLIRNIVGVALAAEKHMAMFLRRGTRLSGILSTEQPLTDAVQKKAEESWNSRFGDLNSSHVGGVALLGGGYKFTPMAVDHQKAQFLELQNHLVEKILRALGVPGVVVGYQGDRASTYASADAFFEKGGIRHCLLPLIVSMEQRDDKVLLPRDGGFFVKRDMSVVERANTRDAFDILVKAAGGPIISRNEARAKLDLNRDDNPGMDTVLKPANMSDGTEPPPAPAGPPPAAEPEDDAPAAPPKPDAPPADEDQAAALRARAWRIAMAAAQRIVRRELTAINGGTGGKGAALRFASDAAGWKVWVVDYYDRHAAHVAEALDISPAAARAYCEGQVTALLVAGGLQTIETWEGTIAPRLAAVALGEAC